MRTIVASVRFRVTAMATVATAAVLVAVGFALVQTERRALTENLDESLVQAATSITDGNGPLPERLAVLGDDDAVAQVVSPDGTVIASSPNADGLGPLADLPRPGTQRLVTADLPTDEAAYRLLVRTSDDGTTVLVGFVTDDIDEAVSTLRSSLLVAVPLAAVALATLVWILVGRTLAPVEAIRAEVAGMNDLRRRVPEPPTGDEVARLARTMNEMLDRLEGAGERQRRFVADASHELRSPLARMQAELEVALAGAADPAATAGSALEEVRAMADLVADLLLLAEADAGAPPAQRQAVDLDEAVRAEARVRRGNGPDIDTSAVAAVQVEADERLLRRAIANLLDNAVRHATRTVRVAVTKDGAGWATVTVDDDGPGIPNAERERIFERFVRLDDSRTSTTGGTGLGLAIAREAAARHGGTVTASAAPGGGARLVLRVRTMPR